MWKVNIRSIISPDKHLQNILSTFDKFIVDHCFTKHELGLLHSLFCIFYQETLSQKYSLVDVVHVIWYCLDSCEISLTKLVFQCNAAELDKMCSSKYKCKFRIWVVIFWTSLVHTFIKLLVLSYCSCHSVMNLYITS